MFKIKSTILIATILFTASTAPMNANEIALTLKDQDITISGDFAGFREQAYIVLTSTGLIHVPAKIVTCEGSDCLVIVSANATSE